MLFRDMEAKNKGISYKGKGNGGVEERDYCFSYLLEWLPSKRQQVTIVGDCCYC